MFFIEIEGDINMWGSEFSVPNGDWNILTNALDGHVRQHLPDDHHVMVF
jgi:hypothetical protein